MPARLILIAIALLSIPLHAFAYDVVLDIDTDGDPGTLRTETEDDSALVSLILQPSHPGESEWITLVTFGLGGTCWECWHGEVPYVYGTDCDLYWNIYDWLDHPLFGESWADISLCLGCCGGSGPGDGFHFIFTAFAAGEGFLLQEPIFLTEFMAWVADGSVFDRCPHPPSNLITFSFQGVGNEIQIGDDFVPAETSNWSRLKSLYR